MSEAFLRERMEAIRARVAEHHEVEDYAFGMVICDGCGRERTVVSDDLDFIVSQFKGWAIGPDGDLCPACAS